MSHDNQESTQDQQNTPVTTGLTGEGAAPDAGTVYNHPQKGQAKSVSAAKLAANRRNAQRSTGPRTRKGKPTVARTAASMGFCSPAPPRRGRG